MLQEQSSRSARAPHSSGPLMIIVGIFSLCLLMLTACGGTTPNTSSGNTGKKGGIINVGFGAEPARMDPLDSASAYDTQVFYNMYDTLFKYDEKNTIQPELATSYTYASPTVLNLMLRNDVTFHDGTPFNADAVVFNINRIINDLASPRHSSFVDVDVVQKISDFQVQIRLKQPFSPLLDALTGLGGMILSPTAIQKLGSKLTSAPIGAGCGPFIFVEWVRGDHILLKANPNYWKKDAQGNRLPYLQGIRDRFIGNGVVMFNNLETDQIQVVTNNALDPTTVAQVKSNPSLTYRQIPGPGFTALFINMAAPPFNNVHMRRAIAWAVNRQELLDKVYEDIGVLSKGPISTASWAYDKSFTGFSYDVNQAKAELAQAGGQTTFTLLLTAGVPSILRAAQFIQAQLQAVGITMNIKQEVFAPLVTDWQTGNYQMAFFGFTGGIDPDPLLYTLFTTHGGFNHSHYSNPAVDVALNAARIESDQAQRSADYAKAQQMIVQDAPLIFIYHPAVYQATSKRVQNYQLLPNSFVDFTSVYLSS